VAVWAHIGGFLTGVVLIKLFVNPELMRRPAVIEYPGARGPWAER
jgi:membrane associated rhomboid family serine protease